MDEMDKIHQLDLITQRILSLHATNIEAELKRTVTELKAAQKRIAELEPPTPAQADKDA